MAAVLALCDVSNRSSLTADRHQYNANSIAEGPENVQLCYEESDYDPGSELYNNSEDED